MRRLFAFALLILSWLLVDIGFAQTMTQTLLPEATTQAVLPEIGWSLPRVMTNLSLDWEAFTFRKIDSVQDRGPGVMLKNGTTLKIFGPGYFFGLKGAYSIGFDDDTLFTESLWKLDRSRDKQLYEIFNALRDSFLVHGYEFKVGTTTRPAKTTDRNRSIAFTNGSTRHVMLFKDTSLRIFTFVDATIPTGIEYSSPTVGWNLKKVAEHYGQPLDRIVLDSLMVDSDTVLYLEFPGRFCKQEGIYLIEFDKDTLLISHTWESGSSHPHLMYNEIVTYLQGHGFKTKDDSPMLLATDSDSNKDAWLTLFSSSVAIQLEGSTITVTTFDRDMY